MKGFIIFLAILAVIIAVAAGVFFAVRSKLQQISTQFFGTPSFIDGYKRQQRELAKTPKSVSAMTGVYLPRIVKDFPAFNLDEARAKAENMLISAFAAISDGNAGRLVNASDELRESVRLIIEGNAAAGRTETYRDVKIHRTEIARYEKGGGKCRITLQSAVEYIHFVTENGELYLGDRELPCQTKYDIDLVYIQDAEKLGDEYGNSYGTVCPNCGAPITNLGMKKCEYCGLAVTEINEYVWVINSYTEI